MPTPHLLTSCYRRAQHCHAVTARRTARGPRWLRRRRLAAYTFYICITALVEPWFFTTGGCCVYGGATPGCCAASVILTRYAAADCLHLLFYWRPARPPRVVVVTTTTAGRATNTLPSLLCAAIYAASPAAAWHCRLDYWVRYLPIPVACILVRGGRSDWTAVERTALALPCVPSSSAG